MQEAVTLPVNTNDCPAPAVYIMVRKHTVIMISNATEATGNIDVVKTIRRVAADGAARYNPTRTVVDPRGTRRVREITWLSTPLSKPYMFFTGWARRITTTKILRAVTHIRHGGGSGRRILCTNACAGEGKKKCYANQQDCRTIFPPRLHMYQYIPSVSGGNIRFDQLYVLLFVGRN